VHPEFQANGPEGLASVIDVLSGTEAPAAAWEADILPSRVASYEPQWLDMLSLTGRARWGRLSGRDLNATSRSAGPVRSSPIALFSPQDFVNVEPASRESLSSTALVVLEVLEKHGASFFHDIVRHAGILPTQAEQALGELVTRGYVTSDSFSGLRALLTPTGKRPSLDGIATKRRGRKSVYSVETAGRWSLLRGNTDAEQDVETRARALLRRYGVVFRRLLARESNLPSWRDLVMVYRRLEARGEIRGGRFIFGMAGEQFALPEAVGMLRAVRKEPKGEEIVLSAADPLNLVGIITPEDRIPALSSNRIYFRDGAPLAALVGGEVRTFGKTELDVRSIEQMLRNKRLAPQLRAYLRTPETKQRWLKQFAARRDLGESSQ
jgi:ATP-dependent helicase Lhr and Lhr-like helicase